MFFATIYILLNRQKKKNRDIEAVLFKTNHVTLESYFSRCYIQFLFDTKAGKWSAPYKIDRIITTWMLEN